MPDTKFEQARRCPTCGNPGERIGISDLGAGDKLHHFLCRNEVCRDFDTGWIVQVSSDGSIPERKPGPKQYPEQNFSGNYVHQVAEELARGRIGN